MTETTYPATFTDYMKNRPGISKVEVSGYKCLRSNQSVDIRPLTLLAGANSSGKSSIIQPLLLLKQTLESPLDPGPLLLNGPHVKFDSTDQVFSRRVGDASNDRITISVACGPEASVALVFGRSKGDRIEILESRYGSKSQTTVLRPGMTRGQIVQAVPDDHSLRTLGGATESLKLFVRPERCFLGVDYGQEGIGRFLSIGFDNDLSFQLRRLMHLPGHRGNPDRFFPIAEVSLPFWPGPFQSYTASIIAQWQQRPEHDKLNGLRADLMRLGLTSDIKVEQEASVTFEVYVGRLLSKSSKGGEEDLVNIADVGFGVSEVLPVLVALRAAEPEQMVYIEQPETHLHPRAQVRLAEVLADAARRGVRVVAETHSSLLLLGIQTLIAEGKLAPELVKLHWFQRSDDGDTTIRSADLDETGAFGEWPEDFGNVALETDQRYLDAAEDRLSNKS